LRASKENASVSKNTDEKKRKNGKGKRKGKKNAPKVGRPRK